MQVRRSVLVAHPAERMFDLIEAAEHYPAFLPWCAGATVLQRDDEVVVARLQVAYLGARFEFTTRNPKRRPEFMAIALEQGPFQRFEGTWHLKPLSSWGSRIDFALNYDFASSVMGSLAAPVFGRIADTLVDAFVQRADRLFAPAGDGVPAPPPPAVAAVAAVAAVPAEAAAARPDSPAETPPDAPPHAQPDAQPGAQSNGAPVAAPTIAAPAASPAVPETPPAVAPQARPDAAAPFPLPPGSP